MVIGLNGVDHQCSNRLSYEVRRELEIGFAEVKEKSVTSGGFQPTTSGVDRQTQFTSQG